MNEIWILISVIEMMSWSRTERPDYDIIWDDDLQSEICDKIMMLCFDMLFLWKAHNIVVLCDINCYVLIFLTELWAHPTTVVASVWGNRYQRHTDESADAHAPRSQHQW